MTFPAKRSCSIGLFTTSAYRCFGSEWTPDNKGLPLHYPHCERLVHISHHAVGTDFGAGFIEGDADVGRRPGGVGVAVADAAHVASFVILFAFLAHGKSTIGEFHVKNLSESWWGECEYVTRGL